MKMLTGSKSKGRNRYYTYYHCFGGCTHRFRAEKANELLAVELQKFRPREEIKDLYVELINEAYYEQTKGIQDEKRNILAQLKDYEKRLGYARNLLATQQIEPDDYRELKSDYNGMINKLESKLATINGEADDVAGLLKAGIDRLLELNRHYDDGKMEETRELIGSIYPDNLTFENNELRTGRVNEAVRLIYMINKEIDGYKKRTKKKNTSLSPLVGDEGFELMS